MNLGPGIGHLKVVHAIMHLAKVNDIMLPESWAVKAARTAQYQDECAAPTSAEGLPVLPQDAGTQDEVNAEASTHGDIAQYPAQITGTLDVLREILTDIQLEVMVL